MIRRPPRSPLFPYPPLSRSEHRLPRLRDHSRHTARRHAEPDGEALGGESHEPCLDGEDPEPHRGALRSEEHTSELQSRSDLVCRLLLEKKKQHNPPLRPPTS